MTKKVVASGNDVSKLSRGLMDFSDMLDRVTQDAMSNDEKYRHAEYALPAGGHPDVRVSVVDG